MKTGIVRLGRLAILLGAALLGIAGLAPTARAQITVGGHVGFVIPWVTHTSGKDFSDTTSVFKEFNVGFPVGVTFKGQGQFAVDLEMIPTISSHPHDVTLIVDPGILYTVSPDVTVGLRGLFDVNSSTAGFIPLVRVNNPFGIFGPVQNSGFFKAYFIEADLPVKFNRPTGGPATNSVTFATHFGLGF